MFSKEDILRMDEEHGWVEEVVDKDEIIGDLKKEIKLLNKKLKRGNVYSRGFRDGYNKALKDIKENKIQI